MVALHMCLSSVSLYMSSYVHHTSIIRRFRSGSPPGAQKNPDLSEISVKRNLRKPQPHNFVPDKNHIKKFLLEYPMGGKTYMSSCADTKLTIFIAEEHEREYVHTQPMDQLYQCSLCDETFVDYNKLIHHHQIDHPHGAPSRDGYSAPKPQHGPSPGSYLLIVCHSTLIARSKPNKIKTQQNSTKSRFNKNHVAHIMNESISNIVRGNFIGSASHAR